ncbi:protein of unknown function (plasmid) [Cupriavidus taiwanensis]|uniref:Uncharacterized protein n=1 Tax=Cupriavidus taiwanensis TaxID=164546 RepID=A0A375IT71_9BURK|nr:protein of unknown function [Cupriavidus taiwanensis]
MELAVSFVWGPLCRLRDLSIAMGLVCCFYKQNITYKNRGSLYQINDLGWKGHFFDLKGRRFCGARLLDVVARSPNLLGLLGRCSLGFNKVTIIVRKVTKIVRIRPEAKPHNELRAVWPTHGHRICIFAVKGLVTPGGPSKVIKIVRNWAA